MTQLQAVSAPPSFREKGLKALESRQGADLVSYLSMVHEQDVAEVLEQAAVARQAVTQVTAAASIDQQMLTSVLGYVQPVLRSSAEASARAGHFSGVIEAVRALVVESEQDGRPGVVTAEQLRRVIDLTSAPAPFRPKVMGFVPACHFSTGHFRHHASGQVFHLPFVGYTTVEEAPERPMTVHVTFLHQGTARSRPQLYTEFGLVMEHME